MSSWLKTALLPNTRLTRAAYLAHLGAAGVPFWTINTIGVLIAFRTLGHSGGMSAIWMPLTGLAFLLSCWLAFCAMANRFHDMGRSGIWALAPLILLAGVSGWLYVTKPDQHYNLNFGLSLITVFFLPIAYFIFAASLALFPSAQRDNRHGSPAPAKPEVIAWPAPRPGTKAPSSASETAAQIKVIDALLRPNLRLDQRGYMLSLSIILVISMAWNMAAIFAVQVFMGITHLKPTDQIYPLFMLISAPVWWISFCVAANRLHDMNYRAPWALAPTGVYVLACAIVSLGDIKVFRELILQGAFLFMLAGLGFTLWLAVAKGQKGANRFGQPMTLALG